MIKITKLACLTLLTMAIMLTACGGENEATGGGNTNKDADNDKIQVVTSYSILYDIVKNVGGDRVDIHSIVPIATDPHEYEPLPEDVQKATDADIMFYNGLNLETGNGWFEKLVETAGKSGKEGQVYRLSEGVEPQYLTSKGNEGEEDPHAWLDIQNGITYAENARDALIAIDPDHTDVYETNAASYIEELEQLHQDAVDRFADIPEEQRVLVTSEGAFKYFSQAYGLEHGYIWEINTENQGTPEQVTSIVDLIKSKKVPALFVETSVDPRSMEMVSSETGVPIVGTVFTDSTGKPGEDGDTYLKMMEWNLDTIHEGLSK